MATSNRTDAPGVLDAFSAAISYTVRLISGSRVGVVDVYDPVRRVAVVSPVRRKRWRGRVFDLPPLVDVPVCWLRFGDMVIAGELKKGDSVLLVALEREIVPWMVTGQPHDPVSARAHAREDCVAIPMISSFIRPITARLPGSMFIGREDATAGVTVTMSPLPGTTTIEGTGPGSISLGSTAVSPALMGTESLTALNTYAGAMTGATAILNTASATYFAFPVPTVPQQNTYIGAWSTYNGSVAGAQTALATALTASLASKTVVE